MTMMKKVATIISVFIFTLVAGLFISYQYFAAKLIENSVPVVKTDEAEIDIGIADLPADIDEISEEEYRQSYEDEENEISDDEFKKYIETEYGAIAAPTGEPVTEPVTAAKVDAASEIDAGMEFENDDAIFERVEITDRIYNVLLFGDDARINEPRARSDSLILVSYNRDTRTIRLTSFMRDMLVPTSLSGGSWNRINAIYPVGGPGRAINVLNKLFSMDMQRYAVVRFAGVFALVDQLGGLDLELKANEAAVINRIFPEYGVVKEGVNHLNGRQVLAYARMRHVDASGDFNRTVRQRYVLRKALEKALESKNVNNLVALMTFAFDNVETNVPLDEVLTIGYELFTGSKPSVEELRLPVDGGYNFARYRGASVFTIDFRKNIKALHEFIYGSSEGVRIPGFNRPSMDAAVSEKDEVGDVEIDGAEGGEADGEGGGETGGGEADGENGVDGSGENASAAGGPGEQGADPAGEGGGGADGEGGGSGDAASGVTGQQVGTSERRGRTTTEPTDTADTAEKVLERRRREKAGELLNPATTTRAKPVETVVPTSPSGERPQGETAGDE